MNGILGIFSVALLLAAAAVDEDDWTGCDLSSLDCKCGKIDAVWCVCRTMDRHCPDDLVFNEEKCDCESKNVENGGGSKLNLFFFLIQTKELF